MEMGKNVRESILIMAALVMVATMVPSTMAIRGNLPLVLAMRQRGFPEAKIEQQLANIMLEAVADNNNNNNALRCIPMWNRCGGGQTHCCPPYTCTSEYYGICS